MEKLTNQNRNDMENSEQPSEYIQIQSSLCLFPPPSRKQNFQAGSLYQLFQLYLYYGSSWSYIKSQLSKRIKDPKNFIYNAIRRSAKVLAKYELDILGKRRRLISRNTLLSMLEIVNQVQKEIMDRGLTLNEDCQLFIFKKTLLRFSLWEDSLEKHQICKMIRMMKTINLKLRCLSIFKAKNRKNWKISQKALVLISSFDKVTIESYPGFELLQEKPILGLERGKEEKTEGEGYQISDYSLEEVHSLFFQLKDNEQRMQKSLVDEVDQILKITNTEPSLLQLLF